MRNWQTGKREPDTAARLDPRAIANDPEGVAAAYRDGARPGPPDRGPEGFPLPRARLTPASGCRESAAGKQASLGPGRAVQIGGGSACIPEWTGFCVAYLILIAARHGMP